MKKYTLALTLALFSFEAQAACTEAPDCTELGFTKTEAECEYGSVKCPWNTGLVYCRQRRAKCQIGWIYYDDETCSEDVKSGKTALGVVVYVNPNEVGGQVMSAWPIDENGNKSNSNVRMIWSTEYVDISSLPNYISQSSAATDFNSCSNTDKIVKQGGVSTYPAAWAARSYAPTNMTKGKWCLPAAGVMTNIYNNQIAVQDGILKLGGVTYPSCCTWSSSEHSTNHAIVSNFVSTLGSDGGLKNTNFYVRPVLEF